MKIDGFECREFLARVRGRDYAHAGEQEAIELVFENIQHQRERRILDAGCGRGGTADFVQRQGFGRVVGIDIKERTIKYAGEKYPDIEFHHLDVIHAGDRFPETF
jgi:cyclopropane fatty-acyl-phospholipid synthase-like methyltransferase